MRPIHNLMDYELCILRNKLDRMMVKADMVKTIALIPFVLKL